jgi:hypothetical protein
MLTAGVNIIKIFSSKNTLAYLSFLPKTNKKVLQYDYKFQY